MVKTLHKRVCHQGRRKVFKSGGGAGASSNSRTFKGECFAPTAAKISGIVSPLLHPEFRRFWSQNCVITEKKGSSLCRSKPMRNLQSVILCKNNESRKSYILYIICNEYSCTASWDLHRVSLTVFPHIVSALEQFPHIYVL